MVYGTQITIVFMGFINQLITGGPHIVGVKQSLTNPFSTNHGDLRTIYHLKESKHMFWAFNNPLRSQNYL